MASQLHSAESQAQELPPEVVNCLENARFVSQTNPEPGSTRDLTD